MKLFTIKLNKRLYLKDEETGKLVYTPPDFIRHKCNRQVLDKLAEEINSGETTYIKAVIKFESNRLNKTKRF